MNRLSISRRKVILGLTALGSFLAPQLVSAQCATPREEGRWRNLDSAETDPAFIDVKMRGCGDEVLNGQQTSSSYSMRVWVRQSTGKFYGRPAYDVTYRPWKGSQWLYGRVPTGGYQDHFWVSAVERNGQRQLHVLIKHQSLDSKPSSTSEYWFIKSA